LPGVKAGMNENSSEAQYLTDFSAQDKPWDDHKGESDEVGGIYAKVWEFEKYAKRMCTCSGMLMFGWCNDAETGESRLRLRNARFCRCRHCPVCQWRRSLMWQARFYQAIPEIIKLYPGGRWVFLTLTVRNCDIANLGETLTWMNAAFQRLKDRKEFKPVLGWIRTTEVTRGADGSAHPHFHTLMMVPSSWFTRDYVQHARWVELWGGCLRVDYTPNVDIRTVKSKSLKTDQTVAESLRGVVKETLKYAVKPSDMVAEPEWFLELTRQSFKRRFVATGGVLKNVLKLDEETDEDLVMADQESASKDDGSRLAFEWKIQDKRYKRAPKEDRVLELING